MQLAASDLFYAHLRAGILSPAISQDQVNGLGALTTEMSAWPLAWAAYGLATAFHETWRKLQPVREVGSDAYLTRMYDPAPTGQRPDVARELGNIEPGDGVKFCGRGFVQLTGRALYAKAAAHLGMASMADEPDMALEPCAAAAILVAGMEGGWFTGRKMANALPTAGAGTLAEFADARRIINGQDKAGLIAGYAIEFQDALQLGRWG